MSFSSGVVLLLLFLLSFCFCLSLSLSLSHLEAVSFPGSSFSCGVSRFHFSLVDAPATKLFLTFCFLSVYLFVCCDLTLKRVYQWMSLNLVVESPPLSHTSHCSLLVNISIRVSNPNCPRIKVQHFGRGSPCCHTHLTATC